MKKSNEQMLTLLNVNEMRDVMGGFVPPTEEQMERLRQILGPLADIICW